METGTIIVTGKGAIHIVPDVTQIQLKLTSLHDTYQEAYEQAKSNTDKLCGIMNEVKLSQNLPKTVRLDIDKKTVTEYDKNQNYKGTKFLGFQLYHLIKISLNMDNVILNSIVKLIGVQLKQAEIEIGYTVKDNRPYQLKVVERAVKDAKEKATIMALAAGCKLGQCKRINYSDQEIHIYSQVRTIHEAQEASYCNPESLDITPDDLQLADSVDVEWYIDGLTTVD